MQKPDFCKNLDFGRGKGNIMIKTKPRLLFKKIKEIWEIDVFPYAKQYDTDKYFPTAYVSTGWKKNFFKKHR